MCAHMRNLLELNKRTLKKDPVSTTGPSAFKSRCAFQMKTPAVSLELTKRLQPYFLQVPSASWGEGLLRLKGEGESKVRSQGDILCLAKQTRVLAQISQEDHHRIDSCRGPALWQGMVEGSNGNWRKEGMELSGMRDVTWSFVYNSVPYHHGPRRLDYYAHFIEAKVIALEGE